MGKYIVTKGQNIYDVALHLTGSIEGVIDLMMCNPELDLGKSLKGGDELTYTDDFIIDPDTVASFGSRGVVPSGGERMVYHKVFEGELLLEAHLCAQQVSASLTACGSGHFQVDWGDNSLPETISMVKEPQRITHRFDNLVGAQRRVRIYGTCRFIALDLSNLEAENIVLMRSLEVEKFSLHRGSATLEFLQLLRDVYWMDLSGLKIGNLLPAAECRELMTLDLSATDVLIRTLDEFLIALAKRHYGRRSCTLTLPATPSGVYREPRRDSDLSYIITSGMEAIWLLTHEENWNQAGAWTVITPSKTYSYEPPSVPDPGNNNHSGGLGN